MTTQQREWNEAIPSDFDATTGEFLWVADGVLGHACTSESGDTVESLLADYAAGYRAGHVGESVEVDWILFRDGEQVDCGSHTFAAELS